MRTLFLSGRTFADSGASSLFHKLLSKYFDKDSLVCFFLLDDDDVIAKKGSFRIINVNSEISFKKPEKSFRPFWVPRQARFLFCYAREMYRKYIEVPRYGRKILRFAKSNDVSRVWVDFKGPTIILISEWLLKKKIFNVHVQATESIGRTVIDLQLDRFTAASLEKSVKFCFANAAKAACASPISPIDGPKVSTANKYTPLFYPLPSLPKDLSVVSRRSDKVVIGLVGSLYAVDSIKKFVESLDLIFWEIDGRKIEIHYWGHGSVWPRRTRAFQKGFIPEKQLVEELRKCDILYLPHLGSADHIYGREDNISSKLSVYLSANRPILFHDPTASVVSQWIQKKKFCVACLSKDIEVIKLSIRKCLYMDWGNKDLKNAHHLISQDFSEETLDLNFKKFMEMAVL